jgi:beta-galactosidase
MQRSRLPLYHDWRFLRADEPEAWQPSFDDSSWKVVSVPHCFNAEDTFLPIRGYYRGPAWYRCRLPQSVGGASGAHIELVALGAFAVTKVWINGAWVGEFMGGFTGFRVDLTPHLVAEGENVLAMRITNEHDPEVLPGKDIPDYNLYGGLYREVELRLTDPLHIADRGLLLSTPSVSHSSGEIALQVRVQNRRRRPVPGRVAVTVLGPGGETASGGEREFHISEGGDELVPVPLPAVQNPKLWSPDAPNLYQLCATLSDDSGVVDSDAINFGFRWYEFDTDRGFFLNGRPLKLRGVNRHQDYPGLGNALPAAFQAYDVQLIKEMGGNFVRCSHYPMHPAFLDACDRLGLLVYAEIASWQHIGGERFADNAVAMMEEMIARDRHHPSIILWGLLNEGREAALFRRLNETAHRLDPDRLTTYAENNPEDALELGTARIPDVLGLNYRTDDLDDLRAKLPGAKLFSSEHTNADAARHGDIEKEVWQMFRVLHDVDQIDRREWMAGSALWCMHDYGTDYGVVWPLQKSGIFDAWRIPKAGAVALRARWTDAPLVHIVGHWNHTGLECADSHFEPHLAGAGRQFATSGLARPGVQALFDAYVKRGQPVPVVVISNLERVELFLNGRSLGARARSKGFVWYVPYEPGVLRAVAQTPHGEIRDERRTAASPDITGTIRLETLHAELPANGTDITLVTATIVDKEGVPVPDIARAISFRVSLDDKDGGADLFGVGGLPGIIAQNGQARIVLRAGRTPGRLRITAEGAALRDGETYMTLISA